MPLEPKWGQKCQIDVLQWPVAKCGTSDQFFKVIKSHNLVPKPDVIRNQKTLTHYPTRKKRQPAKVSIGLLDLSFTAIFQPLPLNSRSARVRTRKKSPQTSPNLSERPTVRNCYDIGPVDPGVDRGSSSQTIDIWFLTGKSKKILWYQNNRKLRGPHVFGREKNHQLFWRRSLWSTTYATFTVEQLANSFKTVFFLVFSKSTQKILWYQKLENNRKLGFVSVQSPEN